MKKQRKPIPLPADRKLTKKEKQVVNTLVSTYVPVRERKEPELPREKVMADILELFA